MTRYILGAGLVFLAWCYLTDAGGDFIERHGGGPVQMVETAISKFKSAAAAPSLAQHQNEQLEKDREWRARLAEEGRRLSEDRQARQAQYEAASAAYDAERKSLAEQIDELSHRRRPAAEIEVLERRRRDLRPPEAP